MVWVELTEELTAGIPLVIPMAGERHIMPVLGSTELRRSNL
jgi:hypothetical protein